MAEIAYLTHESVLFRVGSRIFIGGGGGWAKDYVSAGTLRARKSKSLSAGVQGPLKGTGSSWVYKCSLVLSEPYF